MTLKQAISSGILRVIIPQTLILADFGSLEKNVSKSSSEIMTLLAKLSEKIDEKEQVTVCQKLVRLCCWFSPWVVLFSTMRFDRLASSNVTRPYDRKS